MARVTKEYGGIKDLTIVALSDDEANALARFIGWHAGDGFENGDPALYELYTALVPEAGQ